MLQTVTVPNPAAGADWSVTVPGAYTWKVLGVRATLTAAATPPASTPDLTGFGNTGAYRQWANVVTTYGVAGPFGAGTNLAVDQSPTFLTSAAVVTIPNAGTFDLAQFTYEALVWVRNTGNGSFESICGMQSSVTGHVRDYMAVFRGVGNASVGYFYQGNNVNFPGGTILNEVWAHIALSYDGATWSVYVNGVLTGTSGTGTPDAAVTLAQFDVGGNTVSGSNVFNGRIASCAVFNGALPAANIANHAAALGTVAAYEAAVLADTPVAFWVLDGVSTQQSRAAMLDVTDGTTLVMEIPPGLPQANATTRTYSWVPPVASASAGVNDATQIIPLPPITLRPGYTIGTRTPDKLAGDQWSAITVYVDQQASSDPPAGGDPLAFRSLLLLG